MLIRFSARFLCKKKKGRSWEFIASRIEISYISRNRAKLNGTSEFSSGFWILRPDSATSFASVEQIIRKRKIVRKREVTVTSRYWAMFIITSNAVCDVLIVSVVLEKCAHMWCTGRPGIFGAIRMYAVNITRGLRQSYKIGECAAKYRLSFTKIKYSERNKSALGVESYS